MTAATPEQADDPEIPVRFVQLWLCDLCLDGAGGECHVPGCALWINRAPDIGLRGNPAITILDTEPKPAPELAAAMRESRQLRNIIGTLIDLFDEPDHRNMRHASVTKSTLTRYAAEAGVKP